MRSNEGEVRSIERDLEELWANYSVQPTWMGMSLGNLRRLRDRLNREDVIKFLKLHEREPDDRVIILTGGPPRFADEEDGPGDIVR